MLQLLNLLINGGLHLQVGCSTCALLTFLCFCVLMKASDAQVLTPYQNALSQVYAAPYMVDMQAIFEVLCRQLESQQKQVTAWPIQLALRLPACSCMLHPKSHCQCSEQHGSSGS